MNKTWNYENMITIRRSPKDVLNFMVDLRNIQKLHPYMLSIQQIPRTGKQIKKYKGTDRFPIFMYYSKKLIYEIDLLQQNENDVLFKSNPGAGMTLTVKYSFKQGQNKQECIVVQNSSMTGNILLLPLAWKGLSSSHGVLLQNIKWHLQSKD